jgi:SAM-dependent methyltransferase
VTATLLTALDPLADPVDQGIAETDGMFERHLPHERAWNHYFYCGRSALGAIRLALAAAGTSKVRSILDLPCGHGRVLRVLKAAFPEAELHACDLDRTGVDFLRDSVWREANLLSLEPRAVATRRPPTTSSGSVRS